MKKMLLAALMAATTMSANAATYIHYTATGSGTKNYQSVFNNATVAIEYFDATVDFWYEVGYGCFYPVQCAAAGSKVTFSNVGLFNPQFTLNFDHTLSGFPTTADGFTGGGSFEVSSYYYTFQGQTVTDIGGAKFTALTVEVTDISPYLHGGISYAKSNNVLAGVPELATWALMIGGLALAGAALRRRARGSFAVCEGDMH